MLQSFNGQKTYLQVLPKEISPNFDYGNLWFLDNFRENKSYYIRLNLLNVRNSIEKNPLPKWTDVRDVPGIASKASKTVFLVQVHCLEDYRNCLFLLFFIRGACYFNLLDDASLKCIIKIPEYKARECCSYIFIADFEHLAFFPGHRM